MTISDHGYLGYAVMTDEHFWNTQTPETRRILTEAMKETTEWNETYAEQMNKEQLEEIKRILLLTSTSCRIKRKRMDEAP